MIGINTSNKKEKYLDLPMASGREKKATTREIIKKGETKTSKVENENTFPRGKKHSYILSGSSLARVLSLISTSPQKGM